MKPEELKEKLSAVLVVMVTPFTKNDEVNVEGLRENTRFLVEEGAGRPLVLVPTGSTGEFYTLSDEERKKVIKIVVDEANGKLPVIAGTAQAGTKQTLMMSKYAEDVGADGVMVVLPYYHVPSEEGMYQHYKTIAEGINIGVLIYNNPDTTKCHINPPLMAKLAEVPGIVGDKENTKNLMTYYLIKKLAGDKMPILCGLGEFWFSLEALMGCPGYISGMANYAPGISLELLDAAMKRDFEKVWKIIERLRPLLEFQQKVDAAHGPTTTILPKGYEESYMWLAVIKEAMNLSGLCGGSPRLPILPLTKKEKEELSKVLTNIGIPVK